MSKEELKQQLTEAAINAQLGSRYALAHFEILCQENGLTFNEGLELIHR